MPKNQPPTVHKRVNATEWRCCRPLGGCGGTPLLTLAQIVKVVVKSRFLLGFLGSVPEVAAKIKEPNTKEQKFEHLVKSAE